MKNIYKGQEHKNLRENMGKQRRAAAPQQRLAAAPQNFTNVSFLCLCDATA